MKKGFTLVEMLTTTIIFGMFMLISYPFFNNITNNFNLVNLTQINTLNSMRLYQKLNQINACNSNIYYELNDGLKILIDDNVIMFNDKIYINDMSYDGTLQNYIIKNNFIILNCQIDNEDYKLVLRGNVYEIS